MPEQVQTAELDVISVEHSSSRAWERPITPLLSHRKVSALKLMPLGNEFIPDSHRILLM